MFVTGVATDSDRSAQLRGALADALVADGMILSPEVEAAFRTVPRHLFAPGESLDVAYDAYSTVVPVRDAEGLLLSVVSAPQVQAIMLEMAGIEPGMRVLEIGSGGYNAALIAELTGSGEVTTVDIDPEAMPRSLS